LNLSKKKKKKSHLTMLSSWNTTIYIYLVNIFLTTKDPFHALSMILWVLCFYIYMEELKFFHIYIY